MCGDGNGGGDGDNGGGNGFLVGCLAVGRYPDLYGLGAKSLLRICSSPLLVGRVRQRRRFLQYSNDSSAPLSRILPKPKQRLVRPRRSSRYHFHLTAPGPGIFFMSRPKKNHFLQVHCIPLQVHHFSMSATPTVMLTLTNPRWGI